MCLDKLLINCLGTCQISHGRAYRFVALVLECLSLACLSLAPPLRSLLMVKSRRRKSTFLMGPLLVSMLDRHSRVRCAEYHALAPLRIGVPRVLTSRLLQERKMSPTQAYRYIIHSRTCFPLFPSL